MVRVIEQRIMQEERAGFEGESATEPHGKISREKKYCEHLTQ